VCASSSTTCEGSAVARNCTAYSIPNSDTNLTAGSNSDVSGAGGSSKTVRCNAGYRGNGATLTVTCGAGNAGTGGYTSSESQDLDCAACATSSGGNSCNANAACTNVTCDDGNANSNSDVCIASSTACAGFGSNGCNVVTQYDVNSTCTTCPDNSECDGTTATACGTTTEYKRNNMCTACPAGNTCNGATATVNSCNTTGRPVAAINGQISFSGTNEYGATATFSCDRGYTQSGTTQLTCAAANANDAWPASNAACTSVNSCTAAPTEPINGAISFSAFDNDGSVATFSCDSGYAISGDTTVTCDATAADGTAWESATIDATCTGVNSCTTRPTAATNGAISFSAFDNDDSVATFTCNSDYTISGDTTLTCDATAADGTAWPRADTAATCAYIGATITQDVAFGDLDATDYTGDTKTGYELGYAKALGLTKTEAGATTVSYKTGVTVDSSASRRGATVTFTVTLGSTFTATPPTATSITNAASKTNIRASILAVKNANGLTLTVPSEASITPATAGVVTVTVAPTSAPTTGGTNATPVISAASGIGHFSHIALSIPVVAVVISKMF